ncbi:MAG: YbaB/EbfC family nucleoid-associated protein [Acidobacteriota bacterium]|jgi:nucleoid-associated protein EbfC
MPNMNKLLKQAQKMQEQVQQQMDNLVVETTAGGGMVTVSMDGHKHLRSLKLDPGLLTDLDQEMLEDLVVAAVNEATDKVDEELQGRMGGMMGGLGLPGF